MPELVAELTDAGAEPREALELAALLARAAEPARFDVDVESALARVRPRRRRGLRPVVAIAALAAAAVVLVLALPFSHVDVQARALAAAGGTDEVLHLRETISTRIPGAEQQTRDVWIDASRHRVSWTQSYFGSITARGLVEPGRFAHYTAQENTLLVGASCRALASGCAELVDPVSRYSDALAAAKAPRAVRTTFGNRQAYRFTLPLQSRVQQVVYVDAQTFLPRLIEWRERGVVISTVDVTDVERIARDDAPKTAFALDVPFARVVHVAPAGARLGAVALKPAQAVGAYWLGPKGLTSMRRIRYANGTAVEVRYGTLSVWTYGRAVPPDVLSGRFGEVKPLRLGGRPATFYYTGRGIAVVREGTPRSLALLGPEIDKEVAFAMFGRLRPVPLGRGTTG
jgi:hypothetical protein